jgi:predicted SAM-dependent methyltransferase
MIDDLTISLKNQWVLWRLPQKNLKIHFGAGNNKLADWLNTDLYSRDINLTVPPDMYVDITRPLPFKSNSAGFIYNEHLIEHVEVDKAIHFFEEAHRILKKGGVLRLATPDLEYIVKKYLSRSWKSQDWLTWPEYKFIKTKAEMLNIAMRWWDHKYLYDEEELTRRLREAGFKKIQRVGLGKSKYPELTNLETRKDSKLIIEAAK